MTEQPKVMTYAEWLASKDLPPTHNDDTEYVQWMLSLG